LNDDFESVKKELVDSMTKIIKNYEHITQSIPKVGSKDDSRRLRESITLALTQANEEIIKTEPKLKKNTKFYE